MRQIQLLMLKWYFIIHTMMKEEARSREAVIVERVGEEIA
jgi:hypothetical protein